MREENTDTPSPESEQAPPPSSMVPLPTAARQGGAGRRKPPRWTTAFLRALERCGEVRRAAADAAVDFSTAYARRRAHADFAADWDGALARYRARVGAEEANACHIAAPAPPPPASLAVSLPIGSADREDLIRGARIAKVGIGRWGKGREALFLAELVASANVRRAAKAAGVSTQAVYKRRAKDRRLRQAWDLAVETGKARLQAMLVAAANASLDPDDLPDPEASPLPAVSVREAIAIARLPGPRAKEPQGSAWPEEGEGSDDEYEATFENIIDKLGRMDERARGADPGWGFDEQHQRHIPPGWARPEMMAVGEGGPRGTAEHHCPHCGGGLSLSAATVEEPRLLLGSN